MNAFWLSVLNDPDYQENAKGRILQGKAPHLESYWVNKLNGKPVEQVKVDATLQVPTPVDEIHTSDSQDPPS